jgi:hypothetical protein
MKSLHSALLIPVLSTGLGWFTSAFAHEPDFQEPVTAVGSTWEPETCLNDDECGNFGPLIPMTYNAVGAGLIWTRENWDIPKIHYKGRHSEFKPTDIYDQGKRI